MLRQQCGLCGGFLATPTADVLRCQKCGATFDVPPTEEPISNEVLRQWANQRLETPEPAKIARELLALRAEVARLKDDLEQERVRLAGCLTAAEGWMHGDQPS